jgi:hypothetical protein
VVSSSAISCQNIVTVNVSIGGVHDDAGAKAGPALQLQGSIRSDSANPGVKKYLNVDYVELYSCLFIVYSFFYLLAIAVLVEAFDGCGEASAVPEQNTPHSARYRLFVFVSELPSEDTTQ